MNDATLTLTPTNRLARALQWESALDAQEHGLTAYRPAPIKSFGSWIAELIDDWTLYGTDTRVSIDRTQAAHLWQTVVSNDVFIGSPRVAELAQTAWHRLHEYELPAPDAWQGVPLSKDNRYFQRWSKAYADRCKALGVVDEHALAAELPAALASGLLQPPRRLRLHGFALPPTPLQQALLDACRAAGTAVIEGPEGAAAPSADQCEPLRNYRTDAEELRAATRWARQWLTNEPGARIGIVVPTLAGRVDEVERLLREAFDAPAALLERSGEPNWHVSLGKRLDEWPLVADAMRALAAAPERLSQPELLHLVNTPYLGFADEVTGHWQALASLRNRAPFEVSAFEWRRSWAAEAMPASVAVLERWTNSRRDAPRSAVASAWATQFQRELTALGFGAGKSLDSRTYQCLKRWHQCLEQLGRLDNLRSEPLSRTEALKELRTLAGTAIFRERNVGAQLEVLGVEEAIGGDFDALWISGLDNTRWPGPTRRDPLLPSAIQTSLPGATSETALERARQELMALYRCAPHIERSFATGPDEERAATALLADAPRKQTAEAEPLALGLEPNATCEPAPSEIPTKLNPDSAATAGGTGVLRSQAACPFQAFARYRLNARELEQPRPGLDAADRGELAHAVLEDFFREHPNQAQLHAMTADALTAALEAAVDQTLNKATARFRHLLPGASVAREAQRLQRLLEEWLHAVELPRPPFEVVERETQVTMSFGVLKLEGQLDRVDRLEDGSELLIDYKSNAPSPTAINPDGDARSLREPQLPAYATNRSPPPRALAFAKLRPGKQGMAGYSESPLDIDGIRACGEQHAPADWGELFEDWGQSLNLLADSFVAGDARVAPRKLDECQYCHLKALCRINDHGRRLASDDEPDETDDA